jgi:acetyl-CoA/propionyl-CoA carboxylase, biotin carboxylase, biotin carboxyl carrier protein
VFASVLVANRGEIAVRVIRTLRALGVRAAAVYSDADAGAPHTQLADVAVRLGPAAAADSYLHSERLLAAAERTGAEAVHPGYGFLSENAAFAQAVGDAGLVWIGPPPAAIATMGDKLRAKATVAAAGVPVVPGVHEPDLDDAALAAAAADLGYPVLVKAAAGGGGKGMRVVREPAALGDALAAARREAQRAFGSDALLLERYVERPRHIEVQILADAHGACVHLGERECSLQRRYQKLVEEAPSPVVTADARVVLGAAAVAAARACGYVGAGTVEFITAGDPAASCFLEMNTRLQVEHPVTEAITGLDLVEQQLRVAAGEPLALDQERVAFTGHAVEARVYAEDPARGFLPTGGTVLLAQQDAAGARVDSGVTTGTRVTTDYDPLLAKVVAHGPDRGAALRRLDAALADYHLLGVTTNVAFLRALLAHPDVVAGRLDTGLVERELGTLGGDASPPDDVLVAAVLARLHTLEPEPAGVTDPFDVPDGWRVGAHAWTSWRIRGPQAAARTVRSRGLARDAEVALDDAPPVRAAAALDGTVLTVTAGGERRRYVHAADGAVVWLGRGGACWALHEEPALAAADDAEAGPTGPLVAPMPGTVAAVHVKPGTPVRAGRPLVVIEAMKMEHAVTAPADGVVTELHVAVGDQVRMAQPLAVVAPGAAQPPAGGEPGAAQPGGGA